MTAAAPQPLLLGCDFSSSPTRRKPIVLALGQRQGARVSLTALQPFDTLAAFGQWLAQPGDWVGGFDLPFGLPRELVQALGWPTDWHACMLHYRSLSREQIRAQFAAFCDARPVGGKFAHRATDGPAGSSPSMKWVNPPVATMLHAGLPLLLDAGVHLPGLCAGDPRRSGSARSSITRTRSDSAMVRMSPIRACSAPRSTCLRLRRRAWAAISASAAERVRAKRR